MMTSPLKNGIQESLTGSTISSRSSMELEASLREGIQEVRNDGSPTNWVLGRHEIIEEGKGVHHRMTFEGKGSQGFEEMKQFLEKQGNQKRNGSIFYGMLRIHEQIDMSQTVKFIWITWNGEEFPYVKKAKVGVAKGDVRKMFEPFHLDWELSHMDELLEENIHRRLRELSGKENKVKDIESLDRRHLRGFTSTTTAENQSSRKISGNTIPIMKLQGLTINEEVKEALKDVRNDKTSTNWMLASYPENDTRKPLQFIAKGNGDGDELLKYVSDDNVFYGVLRIIDIIENIKTIKFVFILWTGKNIGSMMRAQIATQKGSIAELFAPYHCECSASDPMEISQAKIVRLVQDTSGSRIR